MTSIRLGILAAFACTTLVAWLAQAGPGRSDETVTDPFLGQAEAIDEGELTYRSKCMGCHGKAGARGPNLFATKLTDEQFLETVINGRKNTQMPAFGLRLSPDDVWKVHAFIKSRDSL
ncbi:c-type cytochrome [Dongia soli]|uniref:Cytochrome c n=1 Tax=Dongia soli TaxID=600628 RepID=A0ABU5EGW6_9PROT|nr:cytochrome c [Dongia soli]MDY0885674.1 cytochrome c [Dongia soli]